MRVTMKKLLVLPAMALTFGLVACESNPTAPALEVPAAPAASLVGLGVKIGQDTTVIGSDSTGFEIEVMHAFPPPPPPPPSGYLPGWP